MYIRRKILWRVQPLKCLPKCVVYLNYLLVHTKSFEGAVQNLEEVFRGILVVGLLLNPRKCALFKGEGNSGNFTLLVVRKKPKVATVRDWPMPHKTRELHSFLGLAFYYGLFMKDFTMVAQLLHQLTEGMRLLVVSRL